MEVMNDSEVFDFSEPIKTPRISVNALAEYIEANANRRKVIVGDCKAPKPFKATRYSEARKAIISFLQNADHSILELAIKNIAGKQDTSKFFDDDRDNSVECLTRFLDFDLNSISDFELIENDQNTLLTIKGLQISINPDLLVKQNSKGKDFIGGIKLRILKNPMGRSQQDTVALMVKRYLENVHNEDALIMNALCLSIDVFANKMVSSPKAEIARMKLIESACEEILLRWPTV